MIQLQDGSVPLAVMHLTALLACASSPPSLPRSAASDHLVFRRVGLPGGTGPVDVEIGQGLVLAVGEDLEVDGAVELDGAGRVLAPAFIDSHVHLAYLPRAAALAAGGLAAAVDLAAPVSFLDQLPGELEVLASGPMVTAAGGYPTQGWGAGGYGLEVGSAEEATQAVQDLHAAGARVVKLPVTSDPVLDADALAAAVEAAHGLGLKVASHALGADEALRAAEAGADVLAHVPTAPLDAEACAAWSERTVIGTLRAFGGSASARDNLAELHARGATVLYGTDFGNTTTAGIDGQELALMQEAGFSGAEILAAGTSAPAAFWGLDHLGAIEPGRQASVLLLSGDPVDDPGLLTTPERVWIAGVER